MEKGESHSAIIQAGYTLEYGIKGLQMLAGISSKEDSGPLGCFPSSGHLGIRTIESVNLQAPADFEMLKIFISGNI